MERLPALAPEQKYLALAASLAAIACLTALGRAVHAAFFGPLRHVPGPWWAAASRLPFMHALATGRTVAYLSALHARHGPVVRFSPNEISFTDGATVWPQVYGHRIGAHKHAGEFAKDSAGVIVGVAGVPSLFMAPEGQHGRQRRVLTHVFGDRALRDQEWLLQRHADRLCRRLRETDVAAGRASAVFGWTLWTACDLLSDLTFGESMDCLEERRLHPFMQKQFDSLNSEYLQYFFSYWPLVGRFFDYWWGSRVGAEQMEFDGWMTAKTLARMRDDGSGRHDFMREILERVKIEEERGNEAMSQAEIISNATLFVFAGMETTSLVLTASMYFMTTKPEVLAKVQDEVRSRFEKADGITSDTTNELKYTIAVMTEAMRCVPPVASGFARKVPAEGGMVSGYFIPGNCNASVSVSQWPAYHSEENFKDANAFAPERWLGDERYKHDKQGAFQPFSFGPRNCIGKTLAWAELRVVLAKLVFHFDMAIEDGSRQWLDKIEWRTVWREVELEIKLTEVKR